jgi:predicted deacylase
MFMPIHVIRGKISGPTLLITAAIHGDELNGVEIIRQILLKKGLSRLKGTLIMVPTVNVYGFLYQSRYLMDRRDLNRSFPGSKKGSIAARLAHLLLHEVAIHATHIIDLHTGSLHRSNLPQIRTNLDSTENQAMARAFNAPVILDLLEPEGSFRHAMKASGKAFLLYEAGEALRFDDFSITVGVKGILRVMRNLHMLPHMKEKIKTKPTFSYNSYWIRAETSGTILFKKTLGSKVEAGEVIATIANPMTSEETSIVASKTGIVIGKSNLPLVHEGEALFHITCLDKPQEVADKIVQLEEVMISEH